MARHRLPGHPRLEQSQQVRRQVQDDGFRRQGPVPGQRPDLRPGRPGDHQEPQLELQGQGLRQRGRVDRGVPAAEANKTWLIGYFYDPQWLLAELPLVPVKLPPYSDQCYGDYSAAARAKIACDYPEYKLNKIVATRFADTGGPAYALVKNFTWKNADQNAVAHYMTADKMSAEDAAKKWLDANGAVWQAWMPPS